MNTKISNAFRNGDEAKFVTCQICEKNVRGKEGFVARHGHRRIKGREGYLGGKGFMTNGCPGSRRLPYEVANDALPEAIERAQKHVDTQLARIEVMRDPEFIEKCRDFGFATTSGYEINENDLDRRLLDVDDEDAMEYFYDIREAMRQYGFNDFAYGQIKWEEFWEAVLNQEDVTLGSLAWERDRLTARYENWEPEITTEEWEENRNIVHDHRTEATNAAWKVRAKASAPETVKPVAVAKVEAEPDADEWTAEGHVQITVAGEKLAFAAIYYPHFDEYRVTRSTINEFTTDEEAWHSGPLDSVIEEAMEDARKEYPKMTNRQEKMVREKLVKRPIEAAQVEEPDNNRYLKQMVELENQVASWVGKYNKAQSEVDDLKEEVMRLKAASLVSEAMVYLQQTREIEDSFEKLKKEFEDYKANLKRMIG